MSINEKFYINLRIVNTGTIVVDVKHHYKDIDCFLEYRFICKLNLEKKFSFSIVENIKKPYYKNVIDYLLNEDFIILKRSIDLSNLKQDFIIYELYLSNSSLLKVL